MKKLVISALFGVAALGMVACDANDGPLEETAEELDDQAEDLADDLED